MGHGDVEHVGHAVFESAEDEHHNAEGEGQVFPQLVGIVLKPVHSNEDQQITEDGQDENADQIIIQFDVHHSLGFLGNAGDAGHGQESSHQKAADEVAHPDGDQVDGEVMVIFKDIGNLPGKQMEPEGAYCKQAHHKEQSPQDFVLKGKKCASPQGDADPGHDAGYEDLESVHLYYSMMNRTARIVLTCGQFHG